MFIDFPLSANGLHISYNIYYAELTITVSYTFSINTPVACYTLHCTLVHIA